MERDKITETVALQKIHAQLPLSMKCKRADIIIDNSRSRDDTRNQTTRLFENMQQISAGRKNMRWICIGVCVVLVCVVLWVYTS